MTPIIDFKDLNEDKQLIIKNLYIKEENKKIFETLFGKKFYDNRPKTWSELKDKDKFYFVSALKQHTSLNFPDDVSFEKTLSFLKLQIIISLGYGGNIKSNEYSYYEHDTFYGIVADEHTGNPQIIPINGFRVFPAFHTREDAEDFLSYNENKELLKIYLR